MDGQGAALAGIVTGGPAMTGAPLREAMRSYLLILLLLLAAAGLASLVALQAGALVTAGGVTEETPAPKVEPEPGEILTLTGEKTLRSQLIPVDPALAYTLSARVRTLDTDGDEMAPTRIYLGVEAFDADRRPLKTQADIYRYAGARNYRLRPIQDWVTVQGEIGGEGEDDHQKFKPGTRYVRIVARINHRSEGRTTEVGEVRFEPRLTVEAQ